jgi:hypothetical protein
MKLAIMQPYLFPYIGYFQLINAVDKFVILDDVNFIKKGWITRNRILVGEKDFLFSVPVSKASQNKKIYECELSEGKWRDKLLRTIEFAYKKAPFFNDCFGTISLILTKEETNLASWLTFQLNTICSYLEIKTIIVETSRIYSNQHLKAQDKIIDICNQEKAEIYLNAIGGKLLYKTDDFKKNNIKLRFLNALEAEYPQFNNTFVPFLSIIDIMMFNNENSIQNLLNKYELA